MKLANLELTIKEEKFIFKLKLSNEYGLKNWGRDIVGKPCWSAVQGQPGPCSFCTRSERLLDPVAGRPDCARMVARKRRKIEEVRSAWRAGGGPGPAPIR